MCQKILHIPSFSWDALYVYNAIKGKHQQSDRFKSRYFLFHVKPRDKDGLIILSKFSAEMFLQAASNGINTFFMKNNIEICVIIWHSHTKIEHPHNHTKERDIIMGMTETLLHFFTKFDYHMIHFYLHCMHIRKKYKALHKIKYKIKM